jgi:hypothetical protein
MENDNKTLLEQSTSKMMTVPHPEMPRIMVLEDWFECEECRLRVLRHHTCYCEGCDKVSCVYCTDKYHVSKGHDCFHCVNMEPFGNESMTVCGNEVCRCPKFMHYLKGQDCAGCKTRNMITVELWCNGFVPTDRKYEKDVERFWAAFETALRGRNYAYLGDVYNEMQHKFGWDSKKMYERVTLAIEGGKLRKDRVSRIDPNRNRDHELGLVKIGD